MSKITHCLWFDTQAEDAANFYISVFEGGKIHKVVRYPAAGQEIHGKPAGSVMTVEFEILGQKYLALNGGPMFKFTEAFSIIVSCKTQQEIDYYWGKLSAHPQNEACGWVKDKYGLSWQITPQDMDEIMGGADPKARDRAMAALMKMKKLDIQTLRAAARG